MPKFAANLNWLFNELDFMDRFEAAAKAGFRGVECLFPYDYDPSEIAKRLADNNLEMVLINAPPGDWQGGERGLGCLKGREREFRDSVQRAITFAHQVMCPKIHFMAGIAADDAKERFAENLSFAGEACSQAGLMGLIEPINDQDMPGYFLTRHEQALEILNILDNPGLGLQLDIYHVVRMGGDPIDAIKLCGEKIIHFQIAGVPERHEPDEGSIDYSVIFQSIDAMDYHGWIGCEYSPRSTTLAGLGWLPPYLEQSLNSVRLI